jgi:predicted acyl esterase
VVEKRAFALAAVAALLLAGCLAGDGAEGRDTPDARGPPVPDGAYRFDEDFAQTVEPGALGVLPILKTFLASDIDGVDIEVGVWLPDAPAGHQAPVIVDAGPYYGNNGPVMDTASGHLGRLIHNFVPHGYAVAAVAVRGTGGSGGCMDLMGPAEVADLSQAVTWLGTQSWSNGNVAMIGKSYDGSTPWMVASAGNPHLKTIVPISGVPDVYELMFRNGTAEIRGPFLLNALYYSFAVREQAPVPQTPDDIARALTHTAEGIPCPDHAVGLAAALWSGVAGDRDATGYWEPRNLKPGVAANYEGSVLLVQGLQDWNVDPALSLPWGDELARSGLVVHQMLGQWGHDYPDVGHTGADDPNMRWDWAEILLHWFDHELKGDASAPLGPPVQVLDNLGRWRVEETWPPHDATRMMLHLSAEGGLVDGDGSVGEALLLPQAVGTDVAPVDLAVPGARADFRAPARDADLLIAGLPLVHVTVAPYGLGGSLAAYLYSVAPDGTETRIGQTQINLRFADGTDQASEVVPGEPLRVRMQIQPMDAVVPAGHELLLRVWAYRDDGSASADVQGRLPSLPPAAIMLEVGGASQSMVSLPVIERGDDAYFLPPRPGGDA